MFNGGMVPGFVALAGVGAAGGGLLGAAPIPAGIPGKSGRTYKPRCVFQRFEFIGDPQRRFRAAQKQKTILLDLLAHPRQNLSFCLFIEINQYVTAEYDVKCYQVIFISSN
jgi:hypothetical protein